jgi:hypothetical protein
MVVEAMGYGKEITADVRGFIDVRIGSLREGTPGRFFEGGHPLDIAGLIAGNVVLELEALTNDQDKAFLIGTVLIRLIEHLRVHHNNSTTLRHVTVIEEAHRLLKNVHDGPAAAAVELFASLLAEIRAYGEGITVVEQIPSKILPDVVKNSALKIMHRLPAADDRQMVGATINLQDHQSENVVSLLPGQAATASDGMDRPVLLRVAHNEQCENASAANTDPPLLASRSPLCGSACRQRPCTLRAMNDAYHHSTEPILVMWVEAAASAQAMAMTPPDPAPALRQRLSPLTDRDLDCTFAYAVERAVAARESHMRSDVDPQDFATHLHTLLSHRLGHSPAPAPIDARCLAYGSYRWRDVLLTVMAAVKDGTDTVPRQYPETEEWAARGLVFTTSTPAEQERELLNRPCYAADRADGPVGDTTRSGIREAVIALTVGTTATHIDTAFRLACTGPHLDTVLERVVEQVAQQFKIGPG